MKRWQVKQADASVAKALSAETRLNTLVTTVMAGRGIVSREIADEFFTSDEISDPFLIKDMDKAVEIISAALENGDKIAIYGDYDCDGVTSTVMLYNHLTALGGEVTWYIPSRDEGYGLNIAAIDKLIADDVRLIITVDNGISAAEEAAYIKDKGLTLVITDHHQPPETLPIADAIVNPNRKDDTSEFKKYAGCGVALKLIMALEDDAESVLQQYADLAAVGTVGDIVPLVGENRRIVKNGLRNIYNTDNAGLYQLVRAAGLDEDRITSTSLAFSICPRINAAGRFAHAKLAAELLMCENEELAAGKARELCDLNEMRRKTEGEIFAEAEKQLSENPSLLNNRVIVLVGEGWSHGVIGIVSSRLLAKYGKPNMVITIEGETARGSARSIEGFSLYRLLERCSDVLIKFGGHTKAAGFTLKTADIEEFIEEIEEAAAQKYPEMPCEIIEADKELEKADLSVQSVEQLSILQPYGEQNPEPIFIMRNARIKSKKPLKDGKYISFIVDFQGMEQKCICFIMSYLDFCYAEGDIVDILVSLEINEYNGQTSIAVKVRDIRAAGLNQDKYFAAKNAYERLARGENTDPRLLKRIIPEMKDIKTVYDLLRRFENLSVIEAMALGGGLNYCMFRVILDVFVEFGLARIDFAAGKACLIPAKEKVDLAKSKILGKIKTAAGV